MTKYAAMGTVLKIQTGSTGAFTSIAQIRNVEGPGLTAEFIDTTTHASTGFGYREIVPTFLDGGEFTFELLFDPGSATHGSTTQNGLIQAWENRSLKAFKIVFPSTSLNTWSFNGYVTGFAVSAPYDDALTANVTVKTSGAFSWSS